MIGRRHEIPGSNSLQGIAWTCQRVAVFAPPVQTGTASQGVSDFNRRAFRSSRPTDRPGHRRGHGAVALVAMLACSWAGTSQRSWAMDPSVLAQFQFALARFEEAQTIRLTSPDRSTSLFKIAAQTLEGILAEGIVSGKLEYNIGNCYLQAGDLGRAMLHYLRAQRLAPRDPLIADNLAEARSRCLLGVRARPGRTVLRSLLFWHYDLSPATRKTMVWIGWVGFWSLMLWRLFVRRRAVTVVAVLAGIVCLVAAGSLTTQHWLDRHAPAAVVVDMDVPVYKGPGVSYGRQFEQSLQPGVELIVHERRGVWWLVELPDGNRGWIDAGTVALVPADVT